MAKYHIFLKNYVGYWAFSPDMVEAVLNKNTGAKVDVLISSLGGFTSDAMLISSLFKNHGNVNVHYIGMNASAATIASMGAAHVSMDVDGLYLVHRCQFATFDFDIRNSEKLEQKIKELQQLKKQADAIDLQVAAMYARRCKKSSDELLALMKEERWLTAAEALDWGFIDEVTDIDEDKVDPVDQKTLSAICAAGVPMPPVSKKDTIMSRFFSWLENTFSTQEKPDQSNQITEPQHSEISDCMRIAAILGVQNLVANDDMIPLSHAQISALEAEIQRLSDQSDQQAQQIKALQELPAAAPSSVTESGAKSSDSDDVNARAIEMFNAIK